MADARIAYGAFCTWWDGIAKVGKHGGLPSCPHCTGLLYEMPHIDQWLGAARRHEAAGHPGYAAMIEWARGKCFKSYDDLETAYRLTLKFDQGKPN